MKTIIISEKCWNKCWMNLVLEFGQTSMDRLQKIQKALTLRYSIVGWSKGLEQGNVQIYYTDSKLIVPFLLRWS